MLQNNIYKHLIPSNGTVIAELACNHEGSVSKLKKLINAIIKTECRIIKTQIFIPEERSNVNHHEWNIFQKLSIRPEQWIQIAKYVKKKKLLFFADIFGEAGLKIAQKCNVDGFKIHSEDFLNFSFIEKVARSNKILLLGIGGIFRSDLFLLLEHLKKKGLTNKLILMPGIQTFPTPLASHSLGEINDLISKYADKYNIKIGCADHISGNLIEAREFPILALATGACIIEKHFTINRSLKWEDYESALDYKNFKIFISNVKKYSSLLKKQGEMNEDEFRYKKKFNKIPVFKKSILKNKIIKKKHIKFIKINNQTSSLSDFKILGKKTNQKTKEGDIINIKKIYQKIGAIIVVRNASKRLPNKAMKLILGKATIVHLIERIKRCKKVNKIILATTKKKEDDIFLKIAKKNKIEIFRGDDINVSKRFLDAATKFKLDHIVRITGDDILRDNEMIDKAINDHLNSSADVTITTNMPYGTQTEIFNIKSIKTIMENAIVPENTEYLEWYLQNSRYFNIHYSRSNYHFDKKLRLTLDYKEDLIVFKKIFENFKNHSYFSINDVLKFLSKNKKIIKINSSKKTKFETFKNSKGLITSSVINTELKI